MTTFNVTSSRPRRSPEQWQAIMDQYLHSGLSQHAFCDSVGIAYSTFSRWHQRLKNNCSGHDRSEPASNLFVEVADDPTADAPPPAWDVELQLGQAMFLRLRTLSC